MKRVFIIHCLQGTPGDFWYPWLRNQLEKNDFEVSVPEMPDTDYPKISPWVGTLKELVGEIDNETYFVGHSIGCQAIFRYLEKLSAETKIGGVVCVGGWFKLQNLTAEEVEITKPWLEEFDTAKVRKIVGDKLTAIFSDDDPYVPIENSETYKEKLGAKIVLGHGFGHFDSEDMTEIPIVLEELLKMAK